MILHGVILHGAVKLHDRETGRKAPAIPVPGESGRTKHRSGGESARSGTQTQDQQSRKTAHMRKRISEPPGIFNRESKMKQAAG